MKMYPMKFPTITSQGTSLLRLVDDYSQAINAVEAAIIAVEKTQPNTLNYPDGGYREAKLNHIARLNLLKGVLREIKAIGTSLPKTN